MSVSKNLVVLSLFVCAITQPVWAKGKVEHFVEKDRGFSIDVPADWEKHQGDYGAALIVLSPLEGGDDKFRENINVVVEEMTTPMTSKDYYKASQELMKKAFNEYKVEKSGTARLGGNEFHYTLFVHKIGKLRARVLQYITVSGKRAYVVTASATPDKFAKFKSQFDTTIATFKLNPVEGPKPASLPTKNFNR